MLREPVRLRICSCQAQHVLGRNHRRVLILHRVAPPLGAKGSHVALLEDGSLKSRLQLLLLLMLLAECALASNLARMLTRSLRLAFILVNCQVL